MRRPRASTAAVGGAAATVALIVGVVAAADAVWVLPSTAPATDAAGNDNGCLAEAVEMTLDGTGGNRHIEMYLRATCPAAADVHWMSFRGSLVEVMPDGTKRTEIPAALIARVQSARDITGTRQAGWLPLCSDPAFRGTHQWLLRGTVKTKQGARDPSPYTAKVHRLRTVTC